MKWGILLFLASLSACATKSTAPFRQAPVPPPLTAQSAAPCETAQELASNDIMALAVKAQEVATLLAQCAEKHAAVVNAYRDARADVNRWNEGDANH